MLFVASVFVYLFFFFFSFYQQEGLWWGRVNKKKKKTNKPTLEEKAANKDKRKASNKPTNKASSTLSSIHSFVKLNLYMERKGKKKMDRTNPVSVYCRYKSLVAVFLFLFFANGTQTRTDAHTHTHTRIHWLAITHWRKRKESDNKQSRLCARGVRETRQSQSSSSSSSPSPSTKVDDVLFRYAIN